MQYGLAIIIGVLAGFFARYVLLRNDYRQYPGYPHGHITHLSLGVIAAFLGAVAIPALVEKEFTAVTFLALAAQQFREIRSAERETLMRVEETELVGWGPDYIEGIAKVFEARSYLVIITSFIVSAVTYFTTWWLGTAAAVILVAGTTRLRQGQKLGEYVDIEEVPLEFEGANLRVGNIVIMNIGLPKSREKMLNDGVGLLLKPKNENARVILADMGQRQAILHDLSILFGIKKDKAFPDLTPLIRLDIDTGVAGMEFVPINRDVDAMIDAIRKIPVLESAQQRPLSEETGRRAAR